MTSMCPVCHGLMPMMRRLLGKDDLEDALMLATAIRLRAQLLDNLTPQESAIVAVIRAVDGRCIMGSEIAAEVSRRGPSEPINIGTFKTLLSYIRQKRPDIGECIETVRGLGYRWSPPGGKDPLCEDD